MGYIVEMFIVRVLFIIFLLLSISEIITGPSVWHRVINVITSVLGCVALCDVRSPSISPLVQSAWQKEMQEMSDSI